MKNRLEKLLWGKKRNKININVKSMDSLLHLEFKIDFYQRTK